MALSPRRWSFRRLLSRPVSSARLPSRNWYSPLVEVLEDRLAPAAVAWDGGGDGTHWGDARNWSNDQLPTAADDVTINISPTSTVNILHNTGADAVKSLQCQNVASLQLTGGSLA